MMVEIKTYVVQEGFSDEIVKSFSEPGVVEKAPGFVDLSIFVQKPRKDEEEVVVMIRWESKEAWKQWELSEPHLEGHRKAREQKRPEFIISSKSGHYELKAIKHPEQQQV
ncbi:MULTISPECIES: antibiotic biosynthesis monooxygenase family protein [Brevibacillus]|jgi:heme oxygenase (staphylobilin-producing)|nr:MULTISPECIES: antibiotic biosynthesis monooxygenase [Brevibacillus]MBU8713515.1 antibiotic biosynthesis monooxygenase [Brevibacillus parabrevis]MED2256011.1 antibiotic biosynthesis monooxygenase [Brevibacillus parabrevis]UED68825.1 antibiotic biosynthesis monooxygenase [Brevibacillus sp. HD3.3A]WDV95115.1 antibiotic biosynthesis monooxygenase [Brevibacillus parabrevis]HBZ81915.1 antibiotic biosynthesis monooxygenase [Brevibacillus sp.]